MNILLCPSFFDGRLDGVGRVSGMLHEALTEFCGAAPWVMSANEPEDANLDLPGRCYTRNYWKMGFDSLFLSRKELTTPGSQKALIVASHAGLAPLARVLSIRFHTPYCVFLHGVELWGPISRRKAWGLAGADLFIANSQYTLSRFQAEHPKFNKVRAQVTALGVPIATPIPNCSRASGSSHAKFIILSVGRIVRSETYQTENGETGFYKGFQYVTEAVFQLSQLGYPVEHHIIGDGDARPLLEAWIQEKGYGSVAKCLGRLSDSQLDQEYAEAYAFAMASEREGFGLVYVEAMARGLPCVCVDVGASPEVVEDEEVGLVAKARDSESLVAAISRLIQDQDLYQRLSASAKHRAQTVYSNSMFKQRLLSAFNDIENK